jgi:predicted transcriptional regulator YdeE
LNFNVQHEHGATVLGIHARASNASPHLIGDLWRRFHSSNDAKAIPARRNDVAYCVYCEYESDHNGPYTVVIGCAVDHDGAVPEGMKKVTIDAGNVVVCDAKGELPNNVFAAWAEIWNAPLERRYQTDFDRYDEDGQVSVHVGVQ